ncbi:hypothetical protein ERJ75_001811400 [Trypanosoma vivax]|nr:hypothetical protein ERJ75_001811400 [Trypanosoma vivax]
MARAYRRARHSKQNSDPSVCDWRPKLLVVRSRVTRVRKELFKWGATFDALNTARRSVVLFRSANGGGWHETTAEGLARRCAEREGVGRELHSAARRHLVLAPRTAGKVRGQAGHLAQCRPRKTRHEVHLQTSSRSEAGLHAIGGYRQNTTSAERREGKRSQNAAQAKDEEGRSDRRRRRWFTARKGSGATPRTAK